MAHTAQPRDDRDNRSFVDTVLDDFTPREAIVTSSTPSLPFVMLAGGILIMITTILLLNQPERAEVAAPPAEGGAVVSAAASAEPQPAPGAAGAAISAIVHPAGSGGPLQLGPALPPGASVVLTVTLPEPGVTNVVVEHARLAADGALQAAEPLTLAALPDTDGRATVEIPVAALIHDHGAGLYRIRLVWNDQVIGRTDAAVNLHQPAGVAIFEAPRDVVFEAGTYTGVEVNARGRTIGQKPFTLGNPSGADAIAYGVFNGQGHVLIMNGVWAGHWMPLSESVRLR